MNTVSLAVDAFTQTEVYFLLRDTVMPRPVARVSSLDREWRPNLAPYCFFETHLRGGG